MSFGSCTEKVNKISLVRFKSYVLLYQLSVKALFARNSIVSSKLVSKQGRHDVRKQNVTVYDFQGANFFPKFKFKGVRYRVAIQGQGLEFSGEPKPNCAFAFLTV